ncbi:MULTISPECIES: P-type conjugative transfer protein TrbJ [unclassified Vibrio]|uniref:P-type conjugative transfer protein TrbJ n=1 Tax=unclassified Vibrio TaxID=2614977 RepID=UPI002964C64E|nr:MULTISPECIES: P-type conjugative transfer protein TrbJ [unclassified Vibrio]MDW1634574.1 P-type conjugative transfer protein TrbJ [Vibrio sp. Vb2907]MDW1705349.1 P-type conjugative transfer protein TrbJ [Vibrio sp. Vb2917]MDW1719905.1 P-type conjugative transfer protein TrbJ [Vibrio sp. Vb2979]
MKISTKILAAKIRLLALGGIMAHASPVWSGIPVADGVNLQQNIISAMEAVTQTAKQIQQYQSQLQQYENMLQNTMAPASYIWDQAQSTIHDLTQATNTLAYYQNQLGSLDEYLGKFQDVAYYRSSPCFSPSGCSERERTAMIQNRRLASESQKKANDALFNNLALQQDNLQTDARQLQRLQSAAQGADGQMAAIGYANQFASNQANQLLQIRSLLIAQQNAVGARMQADADKEALQQAAHEALFDFGSPTDRSQNRGF